MIKAEDLRDLVVRPTLESMELLWPGASREAAVNLLVGIAAHESTIGGKTHLKQVRGPALGIYQIEPATHADTWDNYLLLKKKKGAFIRELLSQLPPQTEEEIHAELIHNLRYATAIARIKIWRADFKALGIAWPEDPNDAEALGKIWDVAYNANPEKGTVEEFVEHYPL